MTRKLGLLATLGLLLTGTVGVWFMDLGQRQWAEPLCNGFWCILSGEQAFHLGVYAVLGSLWGLALILLWQKWDNRR